MFSREHLNDATAHATSPLGFYFADSRAAAEHYAANASDGRPADARVVDAYLAIRKPYSMPLAEAQAIDSPEQARAVRADLERRGFDGIRIRDAIKDTGIMLVPMLMVLALVIVWPKVSLFLPQLISPEFLK